MNNDGKRQAVDRSVEAIVRKLAFGVGTEHEPDSFGMWAGPSLSLCEMLECIGLSEKDCIVAFREDGTEDVIYRWKSGRWVDANTALTLDAHGNKAGSEEKT